MPAEVARKALDSCIAQCSFSNWFIFGVAGGKCPNISMFPCPM